MAGKGRMPGDGRGRQGGGRKAGTPNKITQTMRELLSGFCEENFQAFKESWKNIKSPKDKCKIYLEAQAFVTPKLAAVDLKTNTKRKSFEDDLDAIQRGILDDESEGSDS